MKIIMRDTRLKATFVSALVSLLLAVVIFCFTGFAFFDFIAGAKPITSISEEHEGDFVTMGIDMIFGYYAEGRINSKGEAAERYALGLSDGMLVTILLPERYFESSEIVYDSTVSFLERESLTLTHYIEVTGSLGRLGENSHTMLYDWFGLNREMLTHFGVVGEVEDYSDVLSPLVLRADYYNALPISTVSALTVVGAALMLLSLAMFALVAVMFSKAAQPAKLPVSFIDRIEAEDAEGSAGDGDIAGNKSGEGRTEIEAGPEVAENPEAEPEAEAAAEAEQGAKEAAETLPGVEAEQETKCPEKEEIAEDAAEFSENAEAAGHAETEESFDTGRFVTGDFRGGEGKDA